MCIRFGEKFISRILAFLGRLLGRWQGSAVASGLFFCAFYALLVNIPFWVASRWLGLLPIGWFCLEYSVVGLLSLFAPRILTVILLLLVIAADLINAVCKTYYMAPKSCLANVGGLCDFSGIRILYLAVVVFLIFLVVAIAAVIPPKAILRPIRWWAAMCLIGFVLVSVSADYVAISHEAGLLVNPFRASRPNDTNKYGDRSNLWIGRYPSIRLRRDQQIFGRESHVSSSSAKDYPSMPSATSAALGAAGITTGRSAKELPDLVVIVVESWGLYEDSSVRNALVQSYFQQELLARYKLVQGTVPFIGPTVVGEARELCDSTMGDHIIDANAHELQSCLPDRLARLGYHSVAIHGMSERMFDRRAWYERVGFQKRLFRDQLQQQELPVCDGAFVGICDAAIANQIGHSLETERTYPEFVYWMTLGSHLPVSVPSGLPAGDSCSINPFLAQQPALCSWYQLVANVHESVSRLAMTTLSRPTVFVVVGDHAPPFATPAIRDQFSQAAVPYLVLIPREGMPKGREVASSAGQTRHRND